MVSTGVFLVVGMCVFFSYVHDRFVLPHLVILVQPIAIVVTIVAFGDESGIAAAARGQLIGAVVQLVVFAPLVWGTVLRPRFPLLGWSVISRFCRPIPAAAASLIPVSVVPLVDRVMASGLGEGGISYLAYSWTIALAGGSILSRGIATALFPFLSRQNVVDRDNFQRLVSTGLILFAILIVPVGLGVSVFGERMASVLLVRGNFHSTDAHAVGDLLRWHGISTAALAVWVITNRAAYAMDRYGIVGRIGVVFAILYVALGVAGRALGGLHGIAIANAISWTAIAGWAVAAIVGAGAVHERKPFIRAMISAPIGGACVLAIVWVYNGALIAPKSFGSAIGFAVMAGVVYAGVIRYVGGVSLAKAFRWGARSGQVVA